MIRGIEGILKAKGIDSVVVAVGGVSFRIRVPTSTLSLMGNVGDRIELHTYLHVREDALSLFGFALPEDLEMFEMLIGVSGIGPKTALSLLSALSTTRMREAIATGNIGVLSSVSGVGKKTAARLVLELRSKMEQEVTVVTSLHEDVLAALTALGYSVSEASRAIASIPDSSSLTLEDKIRLALQHLAG